MPLTLANPNSGISAHIRLPQLVQNLRVLVLPDSAITGNPATSPFVSETLSSGTMYAA